MKKNDQLIKMMDNESFKICPPNDRDFMQLLASRIDKNVALDRVDPRFLKKIIPFISDVIAEDLRKSKPRFGSLIQLISETDSKTLIEKKINETDFQDFIDRECEYLESIYKRTVIYELTDQEDKRVSIGAAYGIFIIGMLIELITMDFNEIAYDARLIEFFQNFDSKKSIIPLETMGELAGAIYNSPDITN